MNPLGGKKPNSNIHDIDSLERLASDISPGIGLNVHEETFVSRGLAGRGSAPPVTAAFLRTWEAGKWQE